MYKKYSDSTLLSLPKKELLLHIRAAEQNRDAVEQTLEQHIKNVQDWKPVRHGHWEKRVDGTHFCSRCGLDAPCDDEAVERLSYYCPGCGAKMDEGA